MSGEKAAPQVIYNQTTPFEQLIQPLDIMIDIVYNKYCALSLSKLVSDYKETVRTNKNAADILQKIIADGVKSVLSSLSRTYLKKISNIYSNDGLIYYIDFKLKEIINQQLS